MVAPAGFAGLRRGHGQDRKRRVHIYADLKIHYMDETIQENNERILKVKVLLSKTYRLKHKGLAATALGPHLQQSPCDDRSSPPFQRRVASANRTSPARNEIVTPPQPGPRAKEPLINNFYSLTGSFGGWRRCALVTDRCRSASRLRLAIHQNPGVIQ
jgi:hypothetical protein